MSLLQCDQVLENKYPVTLGHEELVVKVELASIGAIYLKKTTNTCDIAVLGSVPEDTYVNATVRLTSDGAQRLKGGMNHGGELTYEIHDENFTEKELLVFLWIAQKNAVRF